jgi:hypothetical protein
MWSSALEGLSHGMAGAAAMKSIDPHAMSFGRRATAYAVILAVAASIVLPLWFWYIGPFLQQPGPRGHRERGRFTVPFFLTIVLTSAIARLLGFSLAGSSVEVRRKVGGGASPGGPEPVVEVQYPGIFHRAPIAVLPFSLFVASVLFVIMPPPSGLTFGTAGAAAFGGLTLVCLNLFRNPALRLDGEGILGYPSGGLGFRHRFVPWSEVASYAIETSRDDLGQGTKTALTFADSRGVTLLRIRPRSLPMRERERVERFLAEKFPKVEIGDLGEL